MSFISLCMQGLLKHLKCSSEKLTILRYGTLELNDRYRFLKLLVLDLTQDAFKCQVDVYWHGGGVLDTLPYTFPG